MTPVVYSWWKPVPFDPAAIEQAPVQRQGRVCRGSKEKLHYILPSAGRRLTNDKLLVAPPHKAMTNLDPAHRHSHPAMLQFEPTQQCHRLTRKPCFRDNQELGEPLPPP